MFWLMAFVPPSLFHYWTIFQLYPFKRISDEVMLKFSLIQARGMLVFVFNFEILVKNIRLTTTNYSVTEYFLQPMEYVQRITAQQSKLQTFSIFFNNLFQKYMRVALSNFTFRYLVKIKLAALSKTGRIFSILSSNIDIRYQRCSVNTLHITKTCACLTSICLTAFKLMLHHHLQF